VKADEAVRAALAHEPAPARYAPIESYALIGDCHGAALVSDRGSLDWCCLGRFDADPVCWRLLDARRGGYLSITPDGTFTATRAYLPDSNVLRTTFATTTGLVHVTDFMPVGRRPGASTHDYVQLHAPHCVVRIVECARGDAALQFGARLSSGFARVSAAMRQEPGSLVAGGYRICHDLAGLTFFEGAARGTFSMAAGERRVFVLAPEAVDGDAVRLQADALLGVTGAFWREWAAYCRYRGPYREAVVRSALALKLLTYAPTGAIVAAPTTSLPEWIGGSRNWDYRFCWMRDSAFILYALAVLGYGGEARRFGDFLSRAMESTAPELHTLYGVAGETRLPETEHRDVEGHARSAPVRTGNGAYDQHQADVFGEVLDWALLYDAIGGKLTGRTRTCLAELADRVADTWQRPDQSLWEIRGESRHHVHSKLMSWVALDRATRLLGSRRNWSEAMAAILQEVQLRGISKRGHLVQAYGGEATDAALLVIGMLDVPLAPDVQRRTVAEIERELRSGPFVTRYRTEDGLRCDEGAFLMCSFWLVDALLHLGRQAEAQRLFEDLLARTNDVGLLAEEMDPATGRFLGNFPQGFTHLALIQAAIHLALHGRGGPAALRGSHADRARRQVTATLGWRGWWAAFRCTCHVGRLFPSRRSVLDPRLWQGGTA
jgi:alpha,alpha-trehalase